MNKDQVDGALKKAKGKVKEVAGKVVGNKKLKRKGKIEKGVGEVQSGYGDIKEIMLDMRSGRVAYAVLSFGGFLGMGQKLFAVPWSALTCDPHNKRFVLNVEKDRLKDAPGFDKGDWPDMADPSWSKAIHSYYGTMQDPEDARL